MFNKLISQLPFNPGLLSQVSFYASRLKKEQSIRRLGFMFVGLTMFIQVFAVLVPPQQSLAASDSNIMLGGGASTKEGILQKYDADNWVRFVYSEFFHISRDDIVKMQVAHVHLNSSTAYTTTATNDSTVLSENNFIVTAGRRPNGSAGEQVFDAAGAPIYQHTLKSAFSKSPITVLFCSKADCGRYKAIAMDCGNPITDTSETPPPPAPVPTPLPPPPPPPTPTPPTPKPIQVASCLSLVASASSVQVKKQVNFTVSGSAGGGAAINYYVIDFGDGTTANFNLMSPGNYTVAGSHTYNTDGKYLVKATAKTTLGDRTSPSCATYVTVTPTPPVCPYNTLILLADDRCKGCPENPDLPLNDAKCTPEIIKAKAVANTTQKLKDANGTTAHPNDELVYTLTTTNKAKKLDATNFEVVESIGDILDYAVVVDMDGGTIGPDYVVHWPATTIKAGDKLVKKMTFKVKDPIPATNTPSSDAGTFDLKMVNVYGDTVVVNVNPPPAKIVETTTGKLPNTGPGLSLIIGFVATTVFAYFFARSRLLAREVELVRAEYYNGGGF